MVLFQYFTYYKETGILDGIVSGDHRHLRWK